MLSLEMQLSVNALSAEKCCAPVTVSDIGRFAFATAIANFRAESASGPVLGGGGRLSAANFGSEFFGGSLITWSQAASNTSKRGGREAHGGRRYWFERRHRVELHAILIHDRDREPRAARVHAEIGRRGESADDRSAGSHD